MPPVSRPAQRVGHPAPPPTRSHRERFLAARPWLVTGEVVLDTATNTEGVLQQVGAPWREDETPTRAWLRPTGGGREWETAVDQVQPADGTSTNRTGR